MIDAGVPWQLQGIVRCGHSVCCAVVHNHGIIGWSPLRLGLGRHRCVRRLVSLGNRHRDRDGMVIKFQCVAILVMSAAPDWTGGAAMAGKEDYFIHEVKPHLYKVLFREIKLKWIATTTFGDFTVYGTCSVDDVIIVYFVICAARALILLIILTSYCCKKN